MILINCYTGGKCVEVLEEEDDSNLDYGAGYVCLSDEDGDTVFYWSGDYSIDSRED